MGKEQDVINKIHAMFRDELFLEPESPDTDLVKTGVLDSLTLVRLLTLLEEQFGLTVAMDDLDMSDFRSVSSISRWVARQRTGSPEWAGLSEDGLRSYV